MTAFLDRYAAAYGPSDALLRRLTGLLGGEVRADGAWISDTEGRRWLDFGSFGLHLLGHRHPVVTAAAVSQLDRMGLSGKVLGNEAATRCVERLLAATPPRLDRGILANTGAEAVEMAIKMVTLATGRDELLALTRSYHGRTVAALSLSDATASLGRWGLRDRVHFVEPGDIATARRLLETRPIAAVFAEPVQGEGGVRPVAPEFLAALRERCDATRTPLVLDEIQTGLGRCGRRWRSADDCPPDLLLVGKALGGGLVPVSAVLYASPVIGPAATDPLVFASSFAGGALAGTVGATVVELVSDPVLLERVRLMGDAVRATLRTRLGGNAHVRDIRGEGLMIGVELSDPAVAGQVLVEAARRDLLVSFCLSRPEVLRVYPPVVIEPDDLDAGVAAFVAAVAAVTAAPELV
ncbi:aspartate aminotransferase family protein [Micromonospora sp. WMMD1082]|uniref:aspartate aminotransferase family protein n=1 Tax=Micromonospora sp. WMMD1082 TaxID=3016104 RepID=UPI002416912D|nr:aspartate aminotransferase family protein [Micromonospora sp. WMMD1082]MDG4794541.1 aspartate aminotransferase family protein [Micromonospora sp. WMMD1082]